MANTNFEDLPPEVIEQSKKCFLDWTGVALGGSTQLVSSILNEFIVEIGGKEQGTVLGKGYKTSVVNAALINGAMSHALDYDDTHAKTLIHPSAPLIPAILALAEYKNLGGKETILAYVLGFEVETRIGMAMGSYHYASGWHATSTFGRFGAAAASGKLLSLTPGEMAYAFGIAATQAGGLRQVFGTMCKPLHPGKAAMDGILSALLAKKGFTCSPNILEGACGFSETFSKDYDLSIITNGLGETYQILQDTFKPYASCLLTHPTIDAIIELRERYDLEAEEVAAINCELSPFCLDAAGKLDPQNALEGKFSIYFCAALALHDGTAGEDRFTDDKIRCPKIIDLKKKVRASVNPDLRETEARVSIRTRDGRRYEKHVTTPKGDPRNPLSREELEEKFMRLASKVVSTDKSRRIVEKIGVLEKLDNINELIELCY
ncbi:MAG: MmgE/PrpD family protein [Pseudomonadota bacterium]